MAGQEYSGKNMQYVDPITNEKYVPYVVEYSIGADRLMLAVLSEAYEEETLENGETREVMRFSPYLAPYKLAVLPLSKKLGDKASTVKWLRREVEDINNEIFEYQGNINSDSEESQNLKLSSKRLLILPINIHIVWIESLCS